MCGRITATFEFSDIRVRWTLDRVLTLYTPRYNIAPEQISQTVPVIVRHEDKNECRLIHWGLIPYWAKDPMIGKRMINARAETLTDKPAFKHLVGQRRCLIPADGSYEWRKEGKRKVSDVGLPQEPGAIWTGWPVGRVAQAGWNSGWVLHHHLPNDLVRPIHNRMPVILQPEDEEQWLDVSRTSFGKARSLLKLIQGLLKTINDNFMHGIPATTIVIRKLTT